MAAELPRIYLKYHQTGRPMAAMEANWAHGTSTGWHSHPRGQLLYAIEGVMSVQLHYGSWLVPPNRGLWIEADAEHDVRMSGDVKMRTAYIDASAFADLPARTCVVNVSPLLRELVVAAVGVPLDYAEGSRDERLMHLLVDELRAAEVLPLHRQHPLDDLGGSQSGHRDALRREPRRAEPRGAGGHATAAVTASACCSR